MLTLLSLKTTKVDAVGWVPLGAHPQSWKKNNVIFKALFLLPALLTLVAIILFPLLFTVRVSFSSWDVFQSGLDFIGGRNYVRVFEDDRFWQSLQRLSLLSIISVSLQYTLGFALALAVWKQVRGGPLLRVLFLIPMMTTPVVMSVI